MEGVISASDGWAEDGHVLAQPAYALLNIAVGAGATSHVQISAAYVQQEKQAVEGQIDRAAVRLAAALNTALTWSPAATAPQTVTGGYLNRAARLFRRHPRQRSAGFGLDLVQVRAARPAPTAIQWQEAVSDADAYNGEDIVRRFDDATGALLDEADRPLLVSMLRRSLPIRPPTQARRRRTTAAHVPMSKIPPIMPCNAQTFGRHGAAILSVGPRHERLCGWVGVVGGLS